MKIGIISTHAWPIPNPARTGDVFVLDLALALQALGHTVLMVSPAGTAFPNVLPMPCANGLSAPSAIQCESAAWEAYKVDLISCDIVHDISTAKFIARTLDLNKRRVCSTLNGGPWREDWAPRNLLVHSLSQRGRVIRGETDYEGTKLQEMGGPPGRPVREARAVHAGVNTDFYCPTDYAKDDYILWLNRWHPAKGYALAIAFAKATGTKLIMAGENPANETSDYQRACAIEAARRALGVPNIDFRWLPGDPDHDTYKIALYRRARALLYTTQFQEPFGLSQAEALACGTPVIGLRYGSIPEIVDHGQTGYVVADDAGVMPALALGVAWAQTADPTIARDKAVAEFSRTAMAKRYLLAYQDILDGDTW